MIRLGLERCLDDPPAVLRGRRIGLVLNHASVDRSFGYACDLFAERFPGQLAALFSPQHGLWSEQQANMIESGHDRYPPLDLPIYSLYSETRRPTESMLRDIDVLVIDLQDVGTRVYTFIWTMRQCLFACAAACIPVVILDRPNPLGGEIVEGPFLDPAYRSFVGDAPIPLRHGLTIAELARWLNHAEAIGVDLHVVPMDGWRRSMITAETGRTWVAPSPNMQRYETALVYPGQVLLEGTNLSEGRGTTLPFELVGAPWLDPWQLLRELERHEFPGLVLRPVRFIPTFEKHAGQRCGGVSLHITDPAAVRSVRFTVALIDAARRLAPAEFQWRPPPYEYEHHKPPIDILFGSDRLRTRFRQPAPLTVEEITALTGFDEAGWRSQTQPFYLYS